MNVVHNFGGLKMQVRFEKKETVERFVTALYERGVYSPNAPLQIKEDEVLRR